MIQTQVRVRKVTQADSDAVRAFLAGLSPSAQYQRFFTGLGSVSPTLVRELVTVSPRQQIVIALLGTEVIGHAMAVTNRNGAVELGVVVADRHRQRGVATRLVRTLIERMAPAGTSQLRLDMLCENRLVLDWVRRGLPGARFERDGHMLTGYAPMPVALIGSPAA